MKKIVLLSSIFLFVSCGTFNRYLLKDDNDDKNFLKEQIQTFHQQKEIPTTTPLIVIDGKPYRFDVELKEDALPLSRNEVSKIEVLETKVGIAIYGKPGKKGVLIITTINDSNKIKIKKESDGVPENIYVSLDKKQVNRTFLDKINPNDIYTVTVLKDSLILKQFHPNHNYVGAIDILTYDYKENMYRKEFSLLSEDYKNLIKSISIENEYKKINYKLNDTLLFPKNNHIKKLLDLDYSTIKEIDVKINIKTKSEVAIKTQ